MPAGNPAIYRSSHEGNAQYAVESGMLPSTTTTITNLNNADFNPVGYTDLPTLDDARSPELVHAVGSYQGVGIVKGGKAPSASMNMRVGNVDFLKKGVRAANGSDGDGTMLGLPVISFAGGSLKNYGVSRGLGWQLRYALINTMGFQFNERQVVTANVDLQGLFLQRTAPVQSVTQEQLQTLGGTVLTWRNSSFKIGNADYRDVIASASISINNNVQRVGERNDFGDDNPLSGASYSLNPGLELLTVSYTFHQNLPSSLISDLKNSTVWGPITLSASDANLGGTKSLGITIQNNVLQREQMQGMAPGSTMKFSVSTVSNVLSFNATN